MRDLKPGRTLRTLHHLRPTQLAWRAWTLARPPLLAAGAGTLAGVAERQARELRFDDPGLAAAAALRRDLDGARFTERAERFEPARWRRPARDRLHALAPHLFDAAPALAALGHGRQLERELTSWEEDHPAGRAPRHASSGADMHCPWTSATRAVELLLAGHWLAVRGELEHGFERRLARRICLDALTVGVSVEHDLANNHLIRDAKALLFVARARTAGRGAAAERRALRLLERCIDTQILGDGGHFERVPGYHAHVLADLLEIDALLGASSPLGATLDAMSSFLARMLHPDGELPRMGDSTVGHGSPTAAPPPARLLAARPTPSPATRRDDDGGDSGLAVLADARRHLVWRVGALGPPHVTGHAHGDLLSFELSLDGRRAVVDRGVSTYAAGPERDLDRSSRSHNTLSVDGAEQIEAWSSFRTGRRGRARVLARGPGWMVAAHDAFRHLPERPAHARALWLGPEACVVVLDLVRGRGGGPHRIDSGLTLAPGFETSGFDVHALGGAERRAPARVFERMGEPVETERAEIEAEAALPWTGAWVIAPHGALVATPSLRLDDGWPVLRLPLAQGPVTLRWTEAGLEAREEPGA